MKLSWRFGPTLLAVVTGLLLAGGLGYKLVQERNTAIEAARAQTQDFTHVLEEHTRQTLYRVSSDITQALAELARQREAGVVASSQLRESLTALLPADRLIRYYVVLDAQGRVVFSTESKNTLPADSHADADYFLPHVRGADRELVFGAPRRIAASNQWLLPVSHRLNLPDGAFGGVLVAMVQSSYFQSFYDSIDHGSKDFIALFLSSGLALVGSPYDASVVGHSWSRSPLFRLQIPNWPSGTERGTMTGGNVECIYSYRALNDYPVVVSYGLSLDSVLADWHASARRDGWLLLGGLALLLGVTLQLRSTDHMRHRAEKTLAESEASYRSLIDTSPVGIAVHKAGRIAYVNPAVVQMLGAQAAHQIEGRALLDFVHPDGRKMALSRAQSTMMKGSTEHLLEQKLLRLDGSVIDVEMQATAIAYEGKQAIRVSIQDISQRKQAETNLRIAATAFESQEGILVTDPDGVILRANRAFTQITGYSAEEAVGQTPRLLRSDRQDTGFFQSMWQSLQSTGSWRGELWNKRKNGDEYPAQISITAVRDPNGKLTHYVATLTDIALKKMAADEIEQLAYFDPLTKLPNRRLLMDRLRQALSSGTRHSRYGALLFLDLDHFKNLNDTLGHDMGDALLVQVALRLKSVLREGDTVARLGGDEFVLLLEDLSEHAVEAAEQTQIIGKKVLETLNQPYSLGDSQNYSTASIGAVLFSGLQQSLDDLLKQTDLAMYAAKSAGRNTIRFFDPQMQASITERAMLEADLRQALAEQQFQLYYQKQVTHDGHVIGAEVLIRWLHPQRGLVLPGSFIAHAEETGQILAIGDWVLEAACRQIKLWESNPQCQGLRLSVNVSARQFRQPNFVSQVQTLLKHSGARVDRLELELTESMVMVNVQDTVAKMHALKALGVRFAIDDFGTGQSSLSYLTQLPLDQLKIDQSFVRNLGIRPVDALIAQTIIGMANNLGMEVIAEGVETPEQKAFLHEHGCLLCQGYLFGRPMPLEDFERSLADTEGC
ncbi:MAG TPA: EAL domain-containing protein [Rhodoferax sp.]